MLKKLRVIIWGLLVIFILGQVSCSNESDTNALSNGKFVSENGQLKVVGTQLSNFEGEPIVLKGMSSHGIGWYGDYINENSIKYFRDQWHANVFRVAMYTEGSGSYTASPNTNKTKVYEAIEVAIKLGMYVIVDWHILSDGDPNKLKEEAKVFFAEITSKYKNCKNIIYEICNEPNGKNVNWNDNIKPYAEEIIPIIRKESPKSVILLGTANWCQDILDPIDNPIDYKNVMYSCHFYAGTHTDWLRERVVKAIENGVPIFISEWGTSAADGNGGVFKEETLKWIKFLEERNISWVNWSLSNKNETSAALKASATYEGNWTDEDLSESGKIVKEAMLNGASGLE